MFAGRYLWWMLIAVAIFLFFSMCFDYVTWAIVAMSGCAEIAGSCGPIVLAMSGAMKPSGIGLAGAIMVICTFARLHYLSVNWLWAPVALVWFSASAAFPGILAGGWTGQLRPEMVVESLPVAFLFVTVFCAYLFIAFEEGRMVSFGQRAWLRTVIWIAAGYGVLAAIAETPGFGALPARMLGMPWIASTIAAFQPLLAAVCDLGTGSMMPAYAMLAVFVAALFASLLPQDIARRAVPFMLRGSRH
ncbi:hypothetical protein RGR602_CH01070 [Rhizobium gallicum bv. gallicum R602sp]|uniref:Uncharacterized protein n=1 Tax=Rhizobium gallicum bv. gallicum R602sp TaxID=1041138 RepID=A0A0B4X1K4_9HYPH|nr:hypothetical protein [Rhizobium gallicum]AJD40428.1 hypothetical protein RGR602_CH01070 [Rhizobium gallicum bv. gallicum R602sp]TDW20023.1 hypothetical protein EV128_12869 [Rhizobium azibense]